MAANQMNIGAGMSPEHREILQSKRMYLRKNIIPAELVEYLFSARILTDDMKEEITGKGTDSAKITTLLDMLPKRGPKAFHELLKGLRETEQEFVADELEKCM